MVTFSTMPSVGRMALAATSLLAVANAHMYIAEPKPFGNPPKDPLDPSGSNFPCHGAPFPTSDAVKMNAGESFELKMERGGGANTAVHGGGSCQLALFYGSDASKAKDPSAWKVIYSIEGGCPANTKGNLKPDYQDCTTDGEGDCTHVWDIPMPKGVKAGEAILSWTWFNTIGNREMYQNCVFVDIAGGSGEEMDSYPPMFVANLASIPGYETSENTDVAFPSPGKYVTTMLASDSALNYPKATPGGGSGGSGGSGSGPSSYAAPAPTSAPAESSAPAYTSAPAAPSQSASQSFNDGMYTPDSPAAKPTSAPAYGNGAPNVSSGIDAYQNQKGRQTATTFATSVASSAPASQQPSSAAPAPTSYANKNNGSSTDGTSCPEDGALVCIGDSEFGICDHGKAVPRPLASGTVCRDGVISGKSRRFARHIHGAHKH